MYHNPTDFRTLEPFLKQMKTRNLLAKFNNIVADAGYGSEYNYSMLEDKYEDKKYFIPYTLYEKEQTRKYKNDPKKLSNWYYNELAEYAARRMASLGFNTTPVTDPFYPLYAKLENTTNNVLFCYSVSGETTELIELINEFVNDDDTTIICVTSNGDSSIARMSRYVLSYNEDKHHLKDGFDFSSQIPVMYIIEALDHILGNMSQK